MTDLYWDPFDTEIDAIPTRSGGACATRRPSTATSVRLLGAEPLRRRRGRAPRPVDVQLRARHRARADVGAGDGRRDDDLHGPARPHAAAVARVARVHAAPRHSARGAHPRAVRRAARRAVRSARFDYVQDFAARLPAMVIAALLGVPEADQRVRAQAHRPHVPHRARRRDDQRRVAGSRERPHPVPARAARGPRRTPARRHAHRPQVAEITDDTGNLRKLTAIESDDVRQPPHQRRHRDRRPPARLGGGRARRATPTSGPSSRPTRR